VALKIAVPKTTTPDEKRCAASPDTVKKYIDLGCQVFIEKDAGLDASITDNQFKEAGAKIGKSAEEVCKDADIILSVQPPNEEEIKLLPSGSLLISMMNPYNNEAIAKALAKAKVVSFAMELVPRITRAQAMDVLSSQANLAGYKSVLDACEEYGKAIPMMMTAAGTVPPARVFIMGAGVAGLQAIATAKRLGAIVSATDVRPAAKEQVESLGGTFVAVEDEEFKEAETAGGYAKEMSAAYKKKQAALIEETIAKQDIVITTALIPGRPAPVLVTEKMVKSMKPGSVIVDLAVEQGGNCELSKAGKVVRTNEVSIIGHKNIPSRLAASSSALYAKNLLSLVNLLIDKEKNTLSIDWEDEIVQGIALTKDGQVIHPIFNNEKKAKPASSGSSKPKKEESTSKNSNENATKEDNKAANSK
jgi:NAD(P) transhydrogenase subunit alpha